jgi:hypothetical protein
MIQEALKYLFEQGRAQTTVLTVWDDGQTVTKLIRNGSAVELREFQNAPASRDHRFLTLAGLLEYLNSPHVFSDPEHPSPVVVFVGERVIQARLGYGDRRLDWSLALHLSPTPEYSALQVLFEGVSQAELDRLLKTDLFGCLPPELLLVIANLNISAKREGSVEIDPIGLSKSSFAKSVAVSYSLKNGTTARAEIPLDWSYIGPIWTCWDTKYEIALRLSVEMYEDGGVRFIFHPRQLSETLRRVRLDLLNELRAGVPDSVSVFEAME